MSFTLRHRFIVPPATLTTLRALCEQTEDWVWVGSKGSEGKQRLRRHTFRDGALGISERFKS